MRCLSADLTRLYIDIFDGVYLGSPEAFTFGPKKVRSIRTACDECGTAQLDLYMCVHEPHRFVDKMADCGCDCFIFQIEATESSVKP